MSSELALLHCYLYESYNCTTLMWGELFHPISLSPQEVPELQCNNNVQYSYILSNIFWILCLNLKWMLSQSRSWPLRVLLPTTPPYAQAHPSNASACPLDEWVIWPWRSRDTKAKVKRPKGPPARSRGSVLNNLLLCSIVLFQLLFVFHTLGILYFVACQ